MTKLAARRKGFAVSTTDLNTICQSGKKEGLLPMEGLQAVTRIGIVILQNPRCRPSPERFPHWVRELSVGRGHLFCGFERLLS
jgi:hypothetical protein